MELRAQVSASLSGQFLTLLQANSVSRIISDLVPGTGFLLAGDLRHLTASSKEKGTKIQSLEASNPVRAFDRRAMMCP